MPNADEGSQRHRWMLADGHDVTESRMGEGLPGGLIVVRRAQDLPLDATGEA